MLNRINNNVWKVSQTVGISQFCYFTVLQTMGELAGLSSMPLETQEKFLVNIFEQTLVQSGKFPVWTGERRRQFQTLTHPEHLGRPFRVLQQKRG